MNTRTKLVALTFAGLAALSSAGLLLDISGFLAPDTHKDHFVTVGRGDYTVTLTNLRPGDLDAQAFDEDGDPLDEDLLSDNVPMLSFYSPKRQTIKIRVINASDWRYADYKGTIDP